MEPTILIGLFYITICIFAVSLLAFLIPKKFRRIVWVVLGTVLICTYIFQGALRPMIIEQQTEKAMEVLEGHLEEKYPTDSWEITDTDDSDIEPIIYLHVIFNSEPKMVYEYTIEDTVIKQVSMWTLSGESVEESGVEAHHTE
ncbi:hypothetical protein [Jeotgalibacillus campisalis]|uniref:Uncharacterized protein n=1 Tax=Jeotgalibacillus campisalis TaxID=220754 RepID=A0A0C2S295_9BACL|nr:hypothetical protein [Jeotgalibacillus campisalis]KIL48139.1 hypothetical protein KR50_23060 [Jeotgalibacillus campisalis]